MSNIANLPTVTAAAQPVSRRRIVQAIGTACTATVLPTAYVFADKPDVRRQTKTKKKGICGKGVKCEITDAGWYYNWTCNRTPGKIDAEFVPMIKGARDTTPKNFEKIERLKKDHGVTHLLGFNEPDSASQGNTSVAKAIEKWPMLMETGLRLGSPAVTDNKRGRDWFAEFSAKAAQRKFRCDFIAIHRYPNIKGESSILQFLRSLEAVFAKHGLPIWVTEFSGLNFGSKGRKMTRQSNFMFMEKVLPVLERLPYIERYAWYSGARSQMAYLYDQKNADQLGRLGKAYQQY